MVFDSLIFILNPDNWYISRPKMVISVLESLGVSHSTFSSLLVSKRSKEENQNKPPNPTPLLSHQGWGVASVNKDKTLQTRRT